MRYSIAVISSEGTFQWVVAVVNDSEQRMTTSKCQNLGDLASGSSQRSIVRHVGKQVIGTNKDINKPVAKEPIARYSGGSSLRYKY